MKSSTGAHYIALDHVRAVAAFLVFTWHFTHYTSGFPVPFEYVPSVTLFALLDEGQTGVALFMTLSGYLFAKLLDGKSISYPAFLWNRMLRLLPLLTIVVALVGVRDVLIGSREWADFLYTIFKGPIFPTLPNGGWSITVEFHYYLFLPILLWMTRRSSLLPLSVLALAIIIRMAVLQNTGEVQSVAYWTIFGRIDQFVLGMFFFQFRQHVSQRHVLAGLVAVGFTTFYWYFDWLGGFTQYPSYPSPSPLWVVMPTIEGLAYGLLIAWYDCSFKHSVGGASAFFGRIGEYSYSIYLLHFFIVFRGARMVNEYIMDISNFYVACLWAAALFLCMMPVGYLSFRYVEEPFLRLRKNYIK
jgi:peptidoglycan/LPS O-acetylase OafA/YrhL